MRWIRAGLSWLVDQAIEHWATLAVLIGGAAMTYLASVSTFFNQYGPVGWGAAGIISALLLAVIFWIAAKAVDAFADAQVKKSMAVPPTTVNPLRTHFE